MRLSLCETVQSTAAAAHAATQPGPQAQGPAVIGSPKKRLHITGDEAVASPGKKRNVSLRAGANQDNPMADLPDEEASSSLS
eukprot:864217-Amphidinium_carterae.1